MRLVLVTAALLATMAGQVCPLRGPVRGYAGINNSWQQAVLVEPTPTASDRKHGRNAAAPSNPRPSPQHSGDDKPLAAALAQIPYLDRPSFYPRPLNGSRFLRQRLRQQMQGRRTGLRRKAAGGLNMGNRRMRPGIARLSNGSPLPNRRRRPVGSLMSLDQWRNASGILNNIAALQNGDMLLASTVQPKVKDFLSEWHSSYSRSQTKAQDNTVDQRFTTEVATMGENLSITPQASASLPMSGDSSLGATTTTSNKKSMQSLAPKLPYASPPTSLASIPSVHDMTSMHFKKANDSSSGTSSVPNEMLKAKDRKSPERMSARTAATTWFSQDGTKTTPLPTKRSVTRASPDGKEILDSIQSIFQAAKTDEQELSSMKNVNHGNTSPQPLDIFSGVSPTFGFLPSDHVQPALGPKEDTRVPQTQMPAQARQDIVYPTSWTTSRRPYVPGLVPEASALKSQRSTGGDLLLQVGQSIPVQEQQSWSPEHREADAGNIILAGDNIIVGRPAALIQAPTGQTPVLITAAPAYQEHFGGPLHFHTTEEPTVEHDLEDSSLPAWQSQELGPLLDFISTKYKPPPVKAVPPSVTSLQSMISTGRIPEVFRRDQVMDYIREDRLRYQQPSIDRVGEPWKNSKERIRMHPQVTEGVSSGGQFVALSSLALLAAFCGYVLFSAAGTARESRGVFPPLKAAVDEAKNGLYLLIQGLDEYEDHLSKEEEQTDDEKLEFKHTEEKHTTQEDVPSILQKIWNTVVPPEVQVTSGFVKHVAGRHQAVNASSIVRSSKTQEQLVSREPHAIEIPKSEKPDANEFELSQTTHNESHYESVIRPTLGLTSVANSFLNSIINSKAIKSIISQLKAPPPNIEKQYQMTGSQGDREESSPDQLKHNNNLKLLHEPDFKDRYSMTQANSHEPGKANGTPSTQELENPIADDSSQQEGLTIFTGTGTRQGAVREVTAKPPSARKRVILNNQLHVRHNPETDPPRTSAFVDNVPLKPLP